MGARVSEFYFHGIQFGGGEKGEWEARVSEFFLLSIHRGIGKRG